MDHNTNITEELELHITDSFSILESKKKKAAFGHKLVISCWMYMLSVITHHFPTVYADYKTVPPKD